MRNVLIFILLSVLWIPQIEGQTVDIKELEQKIKKAQPDTNLIKLICDYASSDQVNEDTALILLNRATELADSLAYRSGLFDVMIAKGRVYFRKRMLDSNQVVLEDALILADQIKDKRRQALVRYNLGQLYNEFHDKNLAIEYLKTALAFSRQIHPANLELQANIQRKLGVIYFYTNQYDSADYHYRQVANIFETLEDNIQLTRVWLNIGNNLARANQLEESIRSYEKSFAYAKKSGDLQWLTIGWKQIAYTYWLYGDYPNSLLYYQKALKLDHEQDNPREIAISLREISNVYTAMGEYDKAVNYLEQSYDYFDKVGAKKNQANLLEKKASLFIFKKDYKQALALLKEIRDMRIKNKEAAVYYQRNYYSLGICYENLNYPDSALLMLDQALLLHQKANDLLSLVKTLTAQGRILYHQGQSAAAISKLEEAVELARKQPKKDDLIEAPSLLYDIYKYQGNYKKALSNYELIKTIQDTLFNEQSIKEFTRLETNNKFEAERQKFALENARQSYLRQLAIGGLVVAVLLLLVFAWFYRSKQRSNAQLQTLNNEISEQKDKLEELDQLKSRFFTNISHEFRTPLTVINGMANQLDANHSPRITKAKQLIQQNSHLLLKLINQILDLRKLESGQLKVNLVQDDVVAYLRYIFESFHSYAKDKVIEMKFQAEPKSILMDYDPEKWMMIVSNLLSNAIKYTPEDGKVMMEVQHIQGDILQIQINDTGVGISKDKLPQIFDRFYQIDDAASRVGKGTGIGLTLCKELVELLGGSIKVESEIHEGSTFTVHFPITRYADIAQQKQPIQEWILPNQQTTVELEEAPIVNAGSKEDELILIVEDNEDVAQYLGLCLGGEYNLAFAKDGQEGIEKAIALIPDIIVSDVMMPKKNGFEVCDTLKKDERTSHIPIILLTAKADAQSKISGLQRGADDYLTKPFDEEELKIRIRNLLEIRRKLQLRYQSVKVQEQVLEEEIVQEDEFIEKVRLTLEEHLDDENFGIPELCKKIGMSRTQLHRKTKALTGLSTSHFVRSIRLKKAKELLRSTNLNISEIAYEVGFKNHSYFSTSFLQEFGMKPLDYRN